ncbi:flagellar rod assembly protein/muramidase FlgJ [Sulfuricella denitrificans skB26]|uniref:Peptidoglycan hydrolase FlgJ n=1 Tax=Sulfuricella denitrificans (strain DSM 22764 / NBRC 105220 / skB26) TaxID=1163617 RepID=S6B4I2_SULDS|nr:flagellar assembly peptidoglycan hydrolase FlgJ [Sulfuricella denitrificans]BAN35517.1 flagellar rod assembly protein/muramidase FlgJ [Sulfuricella denitrificans skB26]
MIGTQDISSRFALDVQSVDKLRLQVKQDPDAALKAVAQQFEGIFVNMMLKSMREATPKDGMLDSEQGNLYTQLFDQQLAQKLSTGKGLGVADMLVKQLTLKNRLQSSALSPEHKTSPESQVLSPEHVVSVPGTPRSASTTQDSGLRTQDSALSTQHSGSAFKTPQEFVDKLWPHAVEAGKALGIPPRFLLGQAALESGWGKRAIRGQDGQDSLNLFGIKAGAKWDGEVASAATTEYVKGVPQTRREEFRAYGSYAESFRDYAALLRNNPRYQGVLGQDADAAGFARAMQQAGYATDPMYASKLARVVNGETMRQALAG